MCNDLQKKMDEIRKNSELHKLNNSNANRIIANISKANNQEFKDNIRKAKLGRKRPDMVGKNNPAHLPHVSEGKKQRLKGVPKSKKQIEKYLETMKSKPDIICPYCGFVGRNQGNMNRYHLNKHCQK